MRRWLHAIACLIVLTAVIVAAAYLWRMFRPGRSNTTSPKPSHASPSGHSAATPIAFYTPVVPEERVPPKPEPKKADARQDAAAREFLALLGAQDVQVDGIHEFPEDPDSPFVTLSVRASNYPGACRVTMRLDSCRVVGFHGRYAWAMHEPPDASFVGKTPKDGVSREDAFAKVVPVLRYLGLSESPGDYDIQLKDMIDLTPGDLWGCIWFVKKAFDYKGVPDRIGSISLQVLARTGRLVDMCYRKPVVPSKPKTRIPPEQAVGTAKDFVARSHRYDGYKVSFPDTEPELIIGIANHAHDPASANPRPIPNRTPESFYCWEVRFSYTYPLSTAVWRETLWVDVETGEPIGGDVWHVPEENADTALKVSEEMWKIMLEQSQKGPVAAPDRDSTRRTRPAGQ